MATYAIGDVQGCYDALERLLGVIAFDFSRDQLWFAGDLVNRGSDSLKVLRFVRSLGDRQVTVLGNHDLHLLAVYYGKQTLKRGDTFQDVLDAEDGEELMIWLKDQKLVHYDESLNFVMAHAGISPQWNLSLALQCGKEIETVLQGEHYLTLFEQMYGDQPDYWSEELTGWARYRYIVNAFTRMRYCDLDGRLNLKEKGPLGTKPAHLMPWFEIENKSLKNVNIVFGHWASLCGECAIPNIFAIDTGYVWGRTLTALRLEDHRRFSFTNVQS